MQFCQLTNEVSVFFTSASNSKTKTVSSFPQCPIDPFQKTHLVQNTVFHDETVTKWPDNVIADAFLCFYLSKILLLSPSRCHYPSTPRSCDSSLLTDSRAETIT